MKISQNKMLRKISQSGPNKCSRGRISSGPEEIGEILMKYIIRKLENDVRLSFKKK